jgi:glycosyltransferase involved in cell wall biosynthesis
LSEALRVGFETSALEQTRAGTARYVSGVLAELQRRGDVAIEGLRLAGSGRAVAVGRDVAWYLAGLPLAARRRRVRVLHCPTFRAPVASPVPLVVTVHDLAVLRHPQAFKRWSRTYSRAIVPRVVRAADRIAADSEFTKRELVELLGAREEKIRVVPLAPEPGFTPAGPAEGGDYVLAVGTLEPRKNLPRLAVATERAGVELRVVGEQGWGGVGVTGNGVRWLGRVPDETLAALYRGARCFAYPSLYEGFGIPILEAMACGTPVVTSAGGATEEVAGGAAVLVDPLEPESIAAGIADASARRDELAARGRERARAFSWRASADALVAVYRELA